MHMPPFGSDLRKSHATHMLLSASACDTPAMRVQLTPGSFWLDSKFIEYSGGVSPVIEAPVRHARWVLVAINVQGTPVLFYGPASEQNPSLPDITGKSLFPVCWVYVRSNTNVITNDMIFDCRQEYGSISATRTHNQLSGRNEENAHTIESITNLAQVLDEKVSHNELSVMLAKKADADGTTEACFTLNSDLVGVPVEWSGIYVNRGAQPKVGIRYNESTKKWEFTNDGNEWYDFSKDSLDTDVYATSTEYGLVKLSVDPDDATQSIAVGTNDPRLAAIANKVDRTELSNYITASQLEQGLSTKVNTNEVYTKSDVDTLFIPRSEWDTTGTYTRSQINAILALKANVSQVYNKTDVDAKFAERYTNDEINDLVNKAIQEMIVHIDLSGYYTSAETDAILTQYKKSDEITEEIATTVNAAKEELNQSIESGLATKADADNVYTKSEIDDIIENIDTSIIDVKLENYYNKTQTNALLDGKSDKNHAHFTSQIQVADGEEEKLFVTKAQLDFIENVADQIAHKADIDHTHEATEIAETEQRKFVNQEEKDLWNSYASEKADKTHYHSANDIIENVDKRFVCNVEKEKWNAMQPTSEKGKANGYAPLNDEGKLPEEYLPFDISLIGKDGIKKVDTYEDLLAIEEPDSKVIYFVQDASGDETVDSGWAQYVYIDGSFTKIAEGEGIDLKLDWDSIENKPELVTTDDERLHNSNVLGDYVLDDKAPTEGQYLAFDGNNLTFETPSLRYGTYKIEGVDEQGHKCWYRANQENAVSYSIENNQVVLTLDRTADIQAIQFDDDKTNLVNKGINVNMQYTDGTVYDWSDFDGIVPTVQWMLLPEGGGTPTTKSACTFDNDTPLEFRISGVLSTVRVKLLF